MAVWGLHCKQCDEYFIHSRIGDTLADQFDPPKPKFPANGSELECPSCKAKFTYQQHELIYRFEESLPRVRKASNGR
jgi:uncharacterized CHY-type Zn-finger protein